MKRFVLLGSLLLAFVGPAEAVTRYVHQGCTNNITTYNPTGGGGAGSCTGGSDRVYSSIANALSANLTAAGDTLYVRAGTYGEQINSNSQNIPSGTNWANAPLVSAYPSGGGYETVTLNPTGTNSVFNLPNADWVIFQGLILDGVNIEKNPSSAAPVISTGEGTISVRFKDIEVKNSPWSGILGSGYSCEFINMRVHTNGEWSADNGYGSGLNGVYWWGNDSLFDGGEFYDNESYGLRIFNSDGSLFANNNTVRNGKFYDNGQGRGLGGTSTSAVGGGGLVIGDNNNKVYNNMIYRNWWGLETSLKGGTGIKLLNNSFYDNDHALNISDPDSEGVEIRNTILWSNNSGDVISNGGSGTICSNNLGFTNCTAGTVPNPQFVDAASGNLHIQSSSPAIGNGATITDFSTDYDGDNRPQGSGWDIGADEYLAPPSSFTVLVPNTNVSWQVGQPQTITWQSTISGGNQSQTFNATGSWTAPSGVTSVQVDAWGGGGGGGGNNTSADGAGGGGGAAFARETAAAVTPASNYTVTVGAGGAGGVGLNDGSPGGDSWFNTSSIVLAKGGGAGGRPIGGAAGIGGLGGELNLSIGDVKFGGGNGGNGRDNTSGTGGGGGGSGGLTSAGGNGGPGAMSPGVGGTAGGTSGAAGGAGSAAGVDGNPGNVPGAGGGGTGDGGTRTGGAGAAGRVVLSWGSTANVRIELSRNGGSSWEDIAASTPDDGTYDWTVAGATGSNNRVRVSSLAGGGETDTSDVSFTITGSATGTISATSLNGQRFKKGTPIPFAWTYTNVSGNVRIDLSRNSGSTWETVIASTPVTSSAQSWPAETPVSSNCQFRVVSLNDTSVSGTSSGNFRIGGSLTLFGQ